MSKRVLSGSKRNAEIIAKRAADKMIGTVGYYFIHCYEMCKLSPCSCTRLYQIYVTFLSY
jgi:hypothetical protein